MLLQLPTDSANRVTSSLVYIASFKTSIAALFRGVGQQNATSLGRLMSIIACSGYRLKTHVLEIRSIAKTNNSHYLSSKLDTILSFVTADEIARVNVEYAGC
jgi:hypothetical protein